MERVWKNGEHKQKTVIPHAKKKKLSAGPRLLIRITANRLLDTLWTATVCNSGKRRKRNDRWNDLRDWGSWNGRGYRRPRSNLWGRRSEDDRGNRVTPTNGTRHDRDSLA